MPKRAREEEEQKDAMCSMETNGITLLKSIFTAMEKISPHVVKLKFTASGLELTAASNVNYITAFVNAENFSHYNIPQIDVEVWTTIKSVSNFKDTTKLMTIHMAMEERALKIWGFNEQNVKVTIYFYIDKAAELDTTQYEASSTFVVQPSVFKTLLEVVKDGKVSVVHGENKFAFEAIGQGGYVENSRECDVDAVDTKPSYALLAPPLKSIGELLERSRDVQIAYSTLYPTTVRFVTDFKADDPRTSLTLYTSTIDPSSADTVGE